MKDEIYTLKVYSTRMEYDSYRFDLAPEENDFENDYFGMCFNVTVWNRGSLCAKLWGKLFDENLVYASAKDILNAADPIGRAEVALAEAFNDSMDLQVKTDDWLNIAGFSGYIQGLFVMPAYRRRGIASYILTHLEKILRHALNIRIRAVGISPAPIGEMDGDAVDANSAAEGNNAADEMSGAAAGAALWREQERINRAILGSCGYHEIWDLSMQGMMYGNYDEEEKTGTGYYVRVYPA